MAVVIITGFDITKADRVSSFWRHAGLDVAHDGRGRSRRKEHLVKVKYIDANGQENERESLSHNPWLKTKLVGVLGASFLRQKDSKYRAIYDNYKHRLVNHPDREHKTKQHIHNMALRYMIKIFLQV